MAIASTRALTQSFAQGPPPVQTPAPLTLTQAMSLSPMQAQDWELKPRVRKVLKVHRVLKVLKVLKMPILPRVPMAFCLPL